MHEAAYSSSSSSHHFTSLFHPVPCMLLMLSRIHFPSSCSCVGKSACQASLCTDTGHFTASCRPNVISDLPITVHTQQLHILSHCPHTTVPYCSFCPYFQHFEHTASLPPCSRHKHCTDNLSLYLSCKRTVGKVLTITEKAPIRTTDPCVSVPISCLFNLPWVSAHLSNFMSV